MERSAVRLTADDLRELGADADQVQRFERVFPTGMTPHGVTKAIEAGINVYWLMRELAPYSLAEEYHRRRDALAVAYASRRDALHTSEHVMLWPTYKRMCAVLLTILLWECWPVDA